MDSIYEIVTLFIISFLAATILPAQSEIALASIKIAGQTDVVLLVFVATLGNVLGALLNWFLGKYLVHFQNKRWFPIKEKSIQKATKIYEKWGLWTLLLAWMPFIGDPLTLVAGIFRTNIWIFLILVTIGKAVRYIAVVSVF